MSKSPPEQNLWFDRKTSEAVTLAVISLFAVGCLRRPVEPPALFFTELFLIAGVFVACYVVTRSPKFSYRIEWLALIPLTPVVMAFLARALGSPIAYEMSMLTTLGTASLALAIGTQHRPKAKQEKSSEDTILELETPDNTSRLRPMSLVASGFLTLFTVSISDNQSAVLIAIVWMSVCVWHLVANHWERFEQCAVTRVQRNTGLRPMTVILAVVLCLVSGLVARDRLGDTTKLAFGIMPTSGGSKWSDPAARSGIGTGDKAIAAKDHAESFGAVESELFLESTESTLFDMFSDTIGEPKRVKKFERRQGLTPEKFLEAHEKTAKSEKGGGSFTTDRMPPKKHLHLEDTPENAVLQWTGPTGIRLAMNRYDTFDGVEWTNELSHQNDNLLHREIEEESWFCDPNLLSLVPNWLQRQPAVHQVKILKLNSPKIPTSMLTIGVSIKDVNRPDFFGIAEDDTYVMPGRDKVPPLTVINTTSMKLAEDDLLEHLQDIEATTKPLSNAQTQTQLAELTRQWTAGVEGPYAKLNSVVDHLRDEFEFDREATAQTGQPLHEFLQTRSGGDHLFATTAALMARELGLHSRLATGFYVRPSAFDISAGHTNVLPTDVHVWTEIQMNDGRWFPIEPTPGYRQPAYQPSLWLRSKRFLAAYWPHLSLISLLACFAYLTRVRWIDLTLRVLYPIGSLLLPRHRVGLAMRVVQMRAKLAGCPRTTGMPQRDWLLGLTAQQDQASHAAKRFCDYADRMTFAPPSSLNAPANIPNEFVMNLNLRTLRRIATESHA
ncbi:transglutaminase-like domain-containing protein [Rhodopirellula halodulae]|uniref:transglutaminase-like domain-containing protein n=1 Tax=Rhodopirellula halodulae TaxID=2894198 RepID=UPI001E4A2F11|nr:transglutaminase-like domain-containing protein [Rhodopirellula sp. JC737]MCC9655893.1 transglutaminase-like domain-containing protein [Rhodopirellula sp. JC737]